MSHELENARDMVYVGATPWHGLGEQVDSIDRLPNCLDWLVQKADMFFGSNGATQKSAFKAIVRSDTQKELGIATDQYQPHQNKQLWDVFTAFCAAGNMTIETAGTLKGGKIVWILAKIDKNFALTKRGANDRQELYALIATSHDKSMVTLSRATGVRVVCWNTLSMAVSGWQKDENTFKASHRSSFSADSAKDFVKTAILGFESYQQQAEKLISIDLNGMNRPIAMAYSSELVANDVFTDAVKETGLIPIGSEFGKLERAQLIKALASRDDMARSFSAKVEANVTRPLKQLAHDIRTEQDGIAGKTVWGLLNGVTRYVDHTHGRTADSRLSNAWFGQGNNLKNEALDLANQYATALS